MPTSRLTDALTDEHGHLLPPALIAGTVATAAESVRPGGSAGPTP